MVHVSQGSPLCRGYREINRQMARELNELKQLISELARENAQQREECHRYRLRIIELEIKEKRYEELKKTCNTVVNILTKPEETLSLTGPSNEQRSQQSIILPLPAASDIDESGNQLSTANRLDAISEHGDEEEEEYEDELEGDETMKEARHGQQKANNRTHSPVHNVNTPTLYDSLEPADVTSMPPLYQGNPMAEQQTLSIYKCLDETSTPNNLKGRDMFESTPKKPVLACADSRVNMSPVVKDEEQSIRQQQPPQQQQQQEQPNPQQEIEEKVTTKSKRKIKQKEEDAKRPRTYNLRKRN